MARYLQIRNYSDAVNAYKTRRVNKTSGVTLAKNMYLYRPTKDGDFELHRAYMLYRDENNKRTRRRILDNDSLFGRVCASTGAVEIYRPSDFTNRDFAIFGLKRIATRPSLDTNQDLWDSLNSDDEPNGLEVLSSAPISIRDSTVIPSPAYQKRVVDPAKTREFAKQVQKALSLLKTRIKLGTFMTMPTEMDHANKTGNAYEKYVAYNMEERAKKLVKAVLTVDPSKLESFNGLLAWVMTSSDFRSKARYIFGQPITPEMADKAHKELKHIIETYRQELWVELGAAHYVTVRR